MVSYSSLRFCIFFSKCDVRINNPSSQDMTRVLPVKKGLAREWWRRRKQATHSYQTGKPEMRLTIFFSQKSELAKRTIEILAIVQKDSFARSLAHATSTTERNPMPTVVPTPYYRPTSRESHWWRFGNYFEGLVGTDEKKNETKSDIVSFLSHFSSLPVQRTTSASL